MYVFASEVYDKLCN